MRWSSVGITLSWMLALTERSHAHQIPATLEVIGWQNSAPLVLRHTYGLLVRASVDDPWRFLCPAAWGGPEVPEAITVGDEIWVAALVGLRTIEFNGRPVGAPMQQISALDYPRISSLDGVPYALAGTRLWRVESAQPVEVYESELSFDSLAVHRGRLYLGTSSATESLIEVLDPDGTRVETIAIEPPALTVGLAVAGGELHVLVHGAGGTSLVRLSDPPQNLVQSVGYVQGIAVVDGQLFARIDDELFAVRDGVASRIEHPRIVACLGEAASGAYFCLGPNVHRLAPDGSASELLFEMSSVREPDYVALDSAAAIECKNQWFDLEGEAGLSRRMTSDPEPVIPAPMSQGGCSAVTLDRSPIAWALPLLLGLFGCLTHPCRKDTNYPSRYKHFSDQPVQSSSTNVMSSS